MISCSLGIWKWVVLLLVLVLVVSHFLLLVLVLLHRVSWTSPIQAVAWKRKQNTSWSLGSTAVANDPRLHWCLPSRSFQLKQHLSQRFHLLQATSNCMTPKCVALALLSCSALNQALLDSSPKQPRSQPSLAASTGHGSAFWWTRLHQLFLHSQQTQTCTASSKSGLCSMPLCSSQLYCVLSSPAWSATHLPQRCPAAIAICLWYGATALHQVSLKAFWLHCCLCVAPGIQHHRHTRKTQCDVGKVHHMFQHWLHTTLTQCLTKKCTSVYGLCCGLSVHSKRGLQRKLSVGSRCLTSLHLKRFRDSLVCLLPNHCNLHSTLQGNCTLSLSAASQAHVTQSVWGTQPSVQAQTMLQLSGTSNLMLRFWQCTGCRSAVGWHTLQGQPMICTQLPSHLKVAADWKHWWLNSKVHWVSC